MNLLEWLSDGKIHHNIISRKKSLTKGNIANLVAMCVKWYLPIGSTEDLKKEK